MEADKVLMIEETHNTQPENKIAGEVLYSFIYHFIRPA
jgi:hypothetical protein